MTDGAGFVDLAEVIRQVRNELEIARAEGERADVAFTVDRVSLEFSVQIHRTGTGSGGLRIGVVTAELGGTLDRATTHRVQVDLQPESRAGGRVHVSRDDKAPRTDTGS